MTFIHPDDANFTYDSETEWDRADAAEQGAGNPDRAWICSDRDVWHRNPYYVGPRMPHPEDDVEDIDAWREQEAAYEAARAKQAATVWPPEDDLPF